MNYYTYEPCKGVRFYMHQNSELDTVDDIDIDDDVETVVFDWKDCSINFKLRNVMKQFPNVKTLEIGDLADDIEISNFMFPNIRKIVSHNRYYPEGNALIYKVGTMADNILLNEFCLGPNEAIDLSGVDIIADYALEGCRSMKFKNYESGDYYEFDAKSFDGSMFYINQMQRRNFVMFHNCIVGVNKYADKIYFRNLSQIECSSCMDFGNAEVVVDMHDFFYSKQGNAAFITKHMAMRFDPEKAGYDKQWAEIIGHFVNTFSTIESLRIIGDNAPLIIKNGMVITIDGERVVACVKGFHGDVVIPEGVKKIDAYAFSGCNNITSITMPDSVTDIGRYAFSSCVNLGAIKFSDNITYIPEAVCYRCSLLENILLPKNLRVIESYAFGHTNITEITLHENIRKVISNAFCACKNFKKMRIESNAIAMGFFNYNVLNEVEFSDNVVKLPEGFFNLVKLGTVNDDYTGNVIPYITLKYKDKKAFIPRKITSSGYKETERYASMCIADMFEFNFLDTLFIHARTSEMRMSTAFAVYKYDMDENAKKYLKRTGKAFAMYLLENKRNECLVEFAMSGLMTKNTLKNTLNKALECGNNIASGYLLNELNKNSSGSEFSI